MRPAGRHPALPRPLEGSAVALAVPRWANELGGGKLPGKTVRELEAVQRRLLQFFCVFDPLLDRDGSPAANPAEIIPLLGGFHLGLSSFFDAHHAFWRDHRKLVVQQIESAHWEIVCRTRAPPAFDESLVRALGRKLSLLRWPASAVAWLTGQPEAARSLDRIFDRLFRILQLLDDITDIEKDRQSGQVNAVLCAAAAAPQDGRPQLAVAVGVAKVCAAARAELARIRQRVPAGGFARVCADLDQSCSSAEEQAGKLAAYCVTASALDRVVAALA